MLDEREYLAISGGIRSGVLSVKNRLRYEVRRIS